MILLFWNGKSTPAVVTKLADRFKIATPVRPEKKKRKPKPQPLPPERPGIVAPRAPEPWVVTPTFEPPTPWVPEPVSEPDYALEAKADGILEVPPASPPTYDDHLAVEAFLQAEAEAARLREQDDEDAIIMLLGLW